MEKIFIFKLQPVQQALGRFEAEDLSQVFCKGNADIVEIEPGRVLLRKADGIVGHGLAAGQRPAQAFHLGWIKRGRRFDMQPPGNFFNRGLCRHGRSP